MDNDGMEQLELEKAERQYEIIQRAELATRDGYFTRDQFQDLKVFMGYTEINNGCH